MLNKTVEMARSVHGTIKLENNSSTIVATEFDAFARCYKEQLDIFASAQQDIHKMVNSLIIISPQLIRIKFNFLHNPTDRTGSCRYRKIFVDNRNKGVDIQRKYARFDCNGKHH